MLARRNMMLYSILGTGSFQPDLETEFCGERSHQCRKQARSDSQLQRFWAPDVACDESIHPMQTVEDFI
jgi:hypothetical protein